MAQKSPSATSRVSVRSPQEKKEVLRNVVRNTQALENNLNIHTLDNLEDYILQADEINQDGSIEEKINNQDEVVLDSQIMFTSSRIIKKCTYNLTRNMNAFDPIELCKRIKEHISRLPDTLMVEDDELDYTLLGREVIKKFKLTPTFSMLLGTLKAMPKKEHVVRQRAPRAALAVTKRPEKVVKTEKVEDSVEETVEKIRKLIHRHYRHKQEPLDFFALVIDPTHFGKTVENILHVSFLIKDGHIRVYEDNDSILQVGSLTAEMKSQLESRKKPKSIQNVINLTMGKWKELIKVYNIKKPMIDFSNESRKRQHD